MNSGPIGVSMFRSRISSMVCIGVSRVPVDALWQRTGNPKKLAQNHHFPTHACRCVRIDTSAPLRLLPSTVHVRFPLRPRSPRWGSIVVGLDYGTPAK